MVTEFFAPREAASFSGLSLAMVNYLCRHDIVVPLGSGRRGRGNQRRFSFGELIVLKSVAKLLERGVSVLRLRKALVSLRQFHPEITRQGMPGPYLVTDGEDVYLRERAGVLELLRRRQLSFAFVVEMDSVRRDAISFARALTKTGPKSTSNPRKAGKVRKAN